MTSYRNAQECLAAIASHYKSLENYSDVGVVREMGLSGEISCWFDTQYIRPNQFRFQFTTPHPYKPLRHIVHKAIIGSDGCTPYFYKDYPHVGSNLEIEESLALAVAGATGISKGTAKSIADLLLESIGGFSLTMLKRTRFRKNRSFEGQICSRISGLHPHPRGGRFTIWFGTHDLLIRKIIKHKFKHEEIRTNIRTNIHLEKELFDLPVI